MIKHPGVDMISGFATKEGTENYFRRHAGFASDFVRTAQGVEVSSIGIGSYLGDPTDGVDQNYALAFGKALFSGINFLDTAVNYRFQRSERILGKVIEQLVGAGDITREEIVVCTKGGFFPFELNYPEDPTAYIKEHYIQTELAHPEDIAAACHAMTPAYLENQLEQSLKNLGLETLDVYYLHNPEIQLTEVDDQKEFKSRMRAAFEFLESQVEVGKIRNYGLATWNALRAQPDAMDFLSLEDMVMLAREVTGGEHHLKWVQLPFNVAMPEAWILANQNYGATRLPLLKMADRLGVSVVASGSLLQSKLVTGLPEFVTKSFKDIETPAQACLQFSRSVPGLTTALVGMSQPDHVVENLKAAKVPAKTEQELISLFQGSPTSNK